MAAIIAIGGAPYFSAGAVTSIFDACIVPAMSW